MYIHVKISSSKVGSSRKIRSLIPISNEMYLFHKLVWIVYTLFHRRSVPGEPHKYFVTY